MAYAAQFLHRLPIVNWGQLSGAEGAVEDVSGTGDYPACDACEFAIGVLLDVCYLPRRGMGAHCVFMMDEPVDVSVSVDVPRLTSQVCCNSLYDVPSDMECCVGDILRDLGALDA